MVSRQDKPKGRGLVVEKTAVHEMAEKLDLQVPILQPKKTGEPEILQKLKAVQADAFVVVSYGEIIKKSVLDIPRYGCFNIHASLLPRLRGAAPIQRAIMRGDRTTGITIMKMDEGMDTGDMLLTKEIVIHENDCFADVEKALIEAAKEAIVEALDRIESGAFTLYPQNHEEATLAPKISDEELLLKPESNVKDLHNTIRALSPKPGAYLNVTVREKPMRMKIFSSKLLTEGGKSPEPLLTAQNGMLSLQNSTGRLLLETVQLEGRPRMSSQEVLRGYPIEILQLKR